MSEPRTCETCNSLASDAIILPHGIIVLCSDCKAQFTDQLAKAITPAIPAIAQATLESAEAYPDKQAADARCDFCHRLQYEDDLTFFAFDRIVGLCEDCARLTEQIINNTFNVIKPTLQKCVEAAHA